MRMKKYYPKQSRKIRNLFLPLLFLSLLQIGCSKDMYDDPNGKDKSYNSNNVLSEIRSFFEDNATDLQPVDFNFDVKTKSSTRVSNITPAWDGAVITRKDSITNVEIPLSGDFSKLSRIIRRSSTHKAYGFISGITTKLVIQKHERTNHFRQFVVTMIDDFPQARKNNKIRNYSGKSDFSGYIIISSLEGRYLESFRSINGVWSRVYMEPSSGKEPENSAKTTSLRMLSPESTPKTYSFGEMDTYCSVCTNPIGLCSCCKACNGSYWGCSECQVIIYPDCRKCGNRTNECVCCSWCKNYPCTCYTPPQVCPDCNRVNCICSSFICSKCGLRYCNGSCQSSGGGGGTPGGGSGDTSNSPKDLSYLHGNPNYYQSRYDDALTRLEPILPPDYYKGYGEVYYKKFNELKNKLSENGKEWVDKTAKLLHEAITNLLIKNPNIEQNSDAFRKAAFETHADAYIQGGILDLSLNEKMKIFFTVDPKDLFKPEGLSQVWDVGKEQVSRWEQDAEKGMLEGIEFMNNYEVIREQVKIIVSLPPHILFRSAPVEYTDEEINNMILVVYREQIEYFQANVSGFVLPTN